MRCFLVLLVLAVACSDDPEPSAAPEAPEAPTGETRAEGAETLPEAPAAEENTRPVECALADEEAVTFTTEDGITLEGALYASQNADAPAVVLFHMIPPSHDRGNYSRAFIDRLASRCITVLNVDRRGAGNSGGTARDAYEGPGGALDARAAFAFLKEHASVSSTARMAMVGASNGTTALNDYVSSDEPPTELVAAVLLSGGRYTENQTTMAESALRSLPVLFAYPESEADWNEALRGEAPDKWRFEEHTANAHGTRMLSEEAAAASVVSFLAETLGAP